ncbi:MAG: adenylate/guanylate cyclase domain-containing protein [Dehalococcoidia bacterium]
MDTPPIRYARTSDGVNIAYYVVGEGPTVVRTLSWFTHIEQEWTWGHLPWPRLAEHVRLVLYDGRGFGLSDRDAQTFTPDTEMLDVEAVVESAGLQQFAVFGASAGGYTAVRYAAEHPEQVTHLLTLGGSMPPATDEERKRSEEFRTTMAAVARTGWESNSPAFRQMFSSLYLPSGSAADHEGFNALQRAAASGETVARWWVRPTMPIEDFERYARAIDVPALIMRRRGDQLSSMRGSQGLATLVPDAQLVSFDGDNHFFLAHEPELELFIETVRGFLGTEPLAPDAAPGGFQSILFTDLESSTALTQRVGDEAAQEVLRGHNTAVRGALEANGGREVKHTGDGIMAAFPSAVAAVQAGIAIQRALAGGEVRVRVGINAGEPIAEDDDFFGTAVQLAARITDRAEPGQVLVSNVVRELCAGKLFDFTSQGEATLKGFDEPVKLYQVRAG